MTKYTMIEGHEIVISGEYETYWGERVKFVYDDGTYCNDDDTKTTAHLLCLLYEEDEFINTEWYCVNDFMRPWKEKKEEEIVDKPDEDGCRHENAIERDFRDGVSAIENKYCPDCALTFEEPKEEKMKYTTTEGHEIKAGEYEMASGERAVILGVIINADGEWEAIGYITWANIPDQHSWTWDENGNSGIDQEENTEKLLRPWKEKKEKKVYKLSEMRKVWMRTVWGELGNQVYFTEDGAQGFIKNCVHEVLAITPADATEFYVGQNLDDK